MNVRVYVEGGGDGKKLKTECRRAFSHFFHKAGLAGQLPGVVACGSRNDAYDRFCTAITESGRGDYPILLVDSEAAVSAEPWRHLNWQRPADADDEQAQLMVQVMESWFLADRDCLSRYFGRGFNEKKLPKNVDIESVDKDRVFDGLETATSSCRTKGKYSKGKHSFAILEQIDPAKVRSASKHADRLLETLDEKCG